MLSKIVDFVMDNTTYVNRKRMEEDIQKHIGYRTAWIVKDGDKIVAFLRVNIMPNPKEAHVIDLIVNKNYRFTKAAAEIMEIACNTWPQVETIIFERGYDDGMQVKFFRRYNAKKFLRRLQNVERLHCQAV